MIVIWTLLMARPLLSVAVPEIVPPATWAWRFAVEEQITAKTRRPAHSTLKFEVRIMEGLPSVRRELNPMSKKVKTH